MSGGPTVPPLAQRVIQALHMCRLPTPDAHRRMLLVGNHCLIGFPEVAVAVCAAIRFRDRFPQLAATSLYCDHQSRRQPPAGFGDTARSRSTSYVLSSGQTTRVHPTLRWSPPDHLDQVPLAFRSRAATLIPFFDPPGDGVTRHAEGACQSAQAAAFSIGT